MLLGDGVTNVTVTGGGVLDGNGAQFWVWNNLPPGYDFNNASHPNLNPNGRPQVIGFVNSSRIRWANFTVLRSAFWATQLCGVTDAIIDHVRIHVNDSDYCTSDGCFQPANEDGLDIGSSKHVLVRNS